MTARSANRLRRRDDAYSFDLAWEAAIRIGVDRLRSVAYERAVNGTVKPRFYKGEKIGEEVTYDNRLLLSLLGKTPPILPEEKVRGVIENWDCWMESVEDGTEPPPLPEKNRLVGEIRRIIVYPDGTRYDPKTNTTVLGKPMTPEHPEAAKWRSRGTVVEGPASNTDSAE